MEKKTSNLDEKKDQPSIVLDRIEGFVKPKAIGMLCASIIAEIVFLIPVFVWGAESFSDIVSTIIYAVAVGLLSCLGGYLGAESYKDGELPKQRCRASTFINQLEAPASVFFLIAGLCITFFVLGCTVWEMPETIKIILFFVSCGATMNIIYWELIIEDCRNRSCTVCDRIYTIELVDTQKEEKRKAIYKTVDGEMKTISGYGSEVGSFNLSYYEPGYKVRSGTKVKKTLYKTYVCNNCGHVSKKTEYLTTIEDD